MEEQVLIVVDMQNDFIDGALGTAEAEEIVDAVARTIREFSGEVIYTRDTHFEDYLKTQEGRNLPIPHCIKGTEGWQIHERLEVLRNDGQKVFDKNTFGSVELAEYLKEKNALKRVVLVGLCTDICVISNALLIKAYLPETEVAVIESCCAGVTPESHQNALRAMKSCQITVI